MKKALSIIAVVALVAVLVVALVACVPSKPEKAEANLKKAGYETVVVKESDGKLAQITLAAYGDGCVATVTGFSKDAKEGVNIVYFDSADNAKAYWEKHKDEEKEGYKSGRSGKVVYVGTEAAVKAAG